MKVHEYQAKQLFREFNVPVPQGRMAETAEDAFQTAEELGYPCVIKAQVHAGGRGKAGGVKLAKNSDEAKQYANAIVGMKLVSPQTGAEGKLVRKVLVEQGLSIAKELYLAIIVDREKEMPVIMASSEGGVEIEEVAARTPELIHKVHIHPVTGLSAYHIRQLAFKLNLNKPQSKHFMTLLSNLYRLFEARDASLVEINPLVITDSDEVIALDGKINFDDNGLFRHADVVEMRDTHEEEPLEVEASKYDLNYIKLDGSIGCMVNGAGLAMATMDMTKLFGGSPANFLDIGGGAQSDKVAAALRIILADPNVNSVLFNIFGGITRCDEVARGILAALEEIPTDVPMVVRLVGTNEEEGRALLADADMATATTLAEAAQKAVEAAKSYANAEA